MEPLRPVHPDDARTERSRDRAPWPLTALTPFAAGAACAAVGDVVVPGHGGLVAAGAGVVVLGTGTVLTAARRRRRSGHDSASG